MAGGPRGPPKSISRRSGSRSPLVFFAVSYRSWSFTHFRTRQPLIGLCYGILAFRGSLQANGIDLDDNGLIIRREISVGGKGRVWVNNQPATVAVLKQLAPQLGMIHSQAQSMFAFAFDARERLALLDDFAQLSPEAVSDAFHCWQQVRARIAGLERDEQDRLRLVDLWSFQRKEILEATLEAGEDQRLAAEKRVLANAERVYSSARAAYDHLYENDHSAAASIGAAARQLEELARIDEKFRETAAALDLARITIEDIGATLRDYAQNIQASPERLAEVEERLAVLDRLKRKYGQTLTPYCLRRRSQPQTERTGE